ncbi:hypothetical protein K402DRAFT_182764 [Aulographum hederae CBS 113979]|uniref:Uncharacterized protein n=1 Tax=Aulographum hederae CBS 113979 TaxID=1176131 RepID=A0A6G1GQA2_9PEZI|nr:hypothetical protein K402DRAFT_182764 [Aulographum hederae CBS 113979]
MVFTCAWSFIAGASDVRIAFRRKIGCPVQDHRRRVFSFLGSLAWQIWMTAATAALLASNPSHDQDRWGQQFYLPFFAWLVRPLPATAVSITSLLNSSEYAVNARETQLVEFAVGLLSIGFYGPAMLSAFKVFPGIEQTYVYLLDPPRSGLKMLRGGTVLGFIVYIPFVLGLLLSFKRTMKTGKTPKAELWTVMIFNFVKCVVGFLVWGGALMMDPVAFCPSRKTKGAITVLWAFVPIVDCAWRALFSGWADEEGVAQYEVVGSIDA